jgi:hypothetical protein
VGLSTEKVPRIQCVGQLVTTLPWAIKGRQNRGVWGGRLGEDETLLKSVLSFSSIGPVGLKKLRLFRGTPVCPRGRALSCSQRQSVSSISRLEPTVFVKRSICIICKDQDFRSVRYLGVSTFGGLGDSPCAKRVAQDNRVFRIQSGVW